MDGHVCGLHSQRGRSGVHIYLLLPGRRDYLQPLPSLLFKLKMRSARRLAAALCELSCIGLKWRRK